MGPSTHHSELSYAHLVVPFALFRHLFNLYELIVDDLIENDRYMAAEHVIKAFLYKNIKNVNLYRERIMRMEHII